MRDDRQNGTIEDLYILENLLRKPRAAYQACPPPTQYNSISTRSTSTQRQAPQPGDPRGDLGIIGCCVVAPDFAFVTFPMCVFLDPEIISEVNTDRRDIST